MSARVFFKKHMDVEITKQYQLAQLKLDRWFGVGGREQGELVAPKNGKGKVGRPKRERENGGSGFWDRIPLGNQTTCTHERNEKKRFPGWTPPNLRFRCFSSWQIELYFLLLEFELFGGSIVNNGFRGSLAWAQTLEITKMKTFWFFGKWTF